MKHRSHSLNPRCRQSGVVLFVALILLVILSLIGVTAARMQTVEERMARNEDNHQLAAQAAEAALRSAEGGLLSGIYTNFAANTNGLYELTASNGSVVSTMNWGSAAAVLAYAGPPLASIPTGAQAPKFVIESLPPVAMPGESINQVQYATPTTPVAVYRVTAAGTGADNSSTTTIQSIVR
jgi:type IV pilus assembly protein PilX